MLKLRKLIKEHTWDREFGDPLVTFEDVMEKHQVNKLKEAGSWWDQMPPDAQAAYMQDHPGSKQAQDAKDTDDDDEDDYDMGVVPGSRELDDTPEDDDDYDSEKGSSLTSAPGRVPDGDEEPEAEPKSPEKNDAGSRQAVQDIGNVEDAERAYRKHQAGGPYADWKVDKKGDDLRSAASMAAHKVEKRQDAVISGEVEATPEEAQANVQDMEKKIKNWFERPFRGTTPGWAPKRSDQLEMEEKLKQYKKKVKHMKKGFFGSKYETVMIDGKQYNRISEGVEKQPKPKYEFSEFYQRFKR